MSKKWLSLGAGFILLMTLVFYIPAIRGGYVWDDDYYVTNNLTLRTFDGLRRIWLEIGAVPQYYPLVHSSFWVEYHLWQLNPFGYHLVNVLLHALNAILLWLVLRCLCIPGAWLAAAVFALHPIHVESVAWITERKNVLSGCFYLSAILAYLRFLRLDVSSSRAFSSSTLNSPTSDISRYHWGYYTLALVLYLCALLSKTVTCTMPAAILLLLWWKRGHISWGTVLPLIPLFLVGASLGLTTVWIEKKMVYIEGEEEWAFSFVERCLVAGHALWFYAGKLFWPQKLTFIYPRWQIDAGIWWQYLFPLAAGAVFIALWFFRRQIGRAPLVAVLFFAGTLAPALGFFDIFPMRYSFVADHFQYLASIGLIVLCVGVITTILLGFGPLHRTMGFTAYGVMILVLGMLVWQQGHIYKDAETLWQDTIAKNPDAWMAYNNLGNILTIQGKLDEGVRYYKRAIAINPNYAGAYNNLGFAYGKRGMLDEAISECKKALAIDPDFAEAHNNLGLTYANKGMLDEAISEYKKALVINPNYVKARFNLRAAYLNKGRVEKVIFEYKKALSIDPNNIEAHHNLGIAYGKKGMFKEAIFHFKKTIAINPNFAKAYNNLAWIYATSPSVTFRNGEEAVSLATKACELTKFKKARLLDTLAAAYAEAGNFKKAIEYQNRAIDLGQKHAKTALLKRLKLYQSGEAYRSQ